MLVTHKTYNVERAAFLEDRSEKKFFHPILICGCIEYVDGKDNACLFIIHAEGVVEKVGDYATAGSGAAYAELLLKNYHTPDISVEEAIPVVLHAISEVIEIDPNCGGTIRVSLVKPKEGIKMLTNSEIEEIYKKSEPLLDTVEKALIPKILRGEIDAERIRSVIQKKGD